MALGFSFQLYSAKCEMAIYTENSYEDFRMLEPHFQVTPHAPRFGKIISLLLIRE